MVEGPRVIQKEKERHLESVTLIDRLRPGQKVVVWEMGGFASDSSKPMWLEKGDIGKVMSIDSDGDALINFAGKDSGGKSLSTIIKRSKWKMLRVEQEQADGTKSRTSRPVGEARCVSPMRMTTKKTPGLHEVQPPAKRRATEGAAPKKDGSAAPSTSAAVAASPPPEEDEAPLTEEEKARRAVAEAFLKKEPKKGTVRFTFKEPGPIGLRFSKDIPPWILAVNNNTQAARKAPRVPVAGIVMAVNGFEITEKDCQVVMEGLKKRPVVLDIDWPVDQDIPIVNRA